MAVFKRPPCCTAHGSLHQSCNSPRTPGLSIMARQGINLAVESLAAALRRVRSEVGGPHAALRMQTAQLANLHCTLDLLRHLIHRLKLVAKLRVCAHACQLWG